MDQGQTLQAGVVAQFVGMVAKTDGGFKMVAGLFQFVPFVVQDTQVIVGKVNGKPVVGLDSESFKPALQL